MSELRGQKVRYRRACKRPGRNASESRAGLESVVVDADSARTGGRLPRRGEEPTSAPAAVHRGSGSSTYGRSSDATWETRSCAGLHPQRHLGWRRGRESERLVVPGKPGNAGGGKGPDFGCAVEVTKSPGLTARSSNPIVGSAVAERAVRAGERRVVGRVRVPIREARRRAGCVKRARPVR